MDGQARPHVGLRPKWRVCSPKSVESSSAIGYLFARELRASAKVPVGITQTTVGGTPAEAWTSRTTLMDRPALKPIVTEYDESLKGEMAKADVENQAKMAAYDERVPKLKVEV